MTHSDAPIQLEGHGCYLVYAPQLLEKPAASFLSHDVFEQAKSYEPVSHGGRGKAWFIELPEISAVLRSYQRGGLVARFNRQAYLGWSPESSRAYKEWYLLQNLYQQGLPVPRPVAASICRWPFAFIPLYRAHILIERIPDVKTFDHMLSKAVASDELWRSVGACIRRFHDAGVYHADLNANNILIDDQQKVYLIDFDKGEIRNSQNTSSSEEWKRGNLQRLKRSLLKQQTLYPEYYFSEDNWMNLLSGYAGS